MILVNNPGNSSVYWPLEHAKWNGWTPADLIFPFFLWISGYSMAISNNRSPKPPLVLIKRAATLIGLGLLLNAFPFGLFGSHSWGWENWRFMGILQRIGICYGVAALIDRKGGIPLTLLSSFLLLIGYGICTHLGDLSLEGSMERKIDAWVLGNHAWATASSSAPGFDPEGILSSMTATVTLQWGLLSHAFWKNRPHPAIHFVWVGIGCISAALLLNFVWPINKNLWSISFVFLAQGFAMLFFVLLYWIYDHKKSRALSQWPEAFGSNPLLAFVLTILIAKILRYSGAKDQIFHSILLPTLKNSELASLAFAILYTLCFVPFFLALKSRKILVKLG